MNPGNSPWRNGEIVAAASAGAVAVCARARTGGKESVILCVFDAVVSGASLRGVFQVAFHYRRPGRPCGRVFSFGGRKPGLSREAPPLPPRKTQWSQDVTRNSNALDLEPGVFTLDDPSEIATSLKRSAEASDRRKSTPFRSAMSMLTFYINRAGRDLPRERLDVLEAAKGELRKAFGRVPSQEGAATRK
jgi:hypothetical protein